MSKMKLKGKFQIQLERKGVIVKSITSPNLVMDAALDSILDIMFDSGTQITTWYAGLIDNAGYTEIDNTDTMAAHPGWVENVDYSEGTRQIWSPDPALGEEISNPITTLATFTMSAGVTLKGAFITSDATKGGAVGLLWNASEFTGPDLAVVALDVVRVQYILGASSS